VQCSPIRGQSIVRPLIGTCRVKAERVTIVPVNIHSDVVGTIRSEVTLGGCVVVDEGHHDASIAVLILYVLEVDWVGDSDTLTALVYSFSGCKRMTGPPLVI